MRTQQLPLDILYHKLVNLCVVFIILYGFGTFVAYAQTDKQPQRGISSTGSYAIGDIETVNTQNGNVMFNFPLASLPKGRGGNTGATVGLIYNSKLWDQEPSDYPVYCTDPNPGPCRNWVTKRLTYLYSSTNGGWRYPLWYKLEQFHADYEHRSNSYNVTNRCANISSGGSAMDHYVIRQRIQFPDGSAVEFRDSSNNYYGYFTHDMAGRNYYCASDSTGGHLEASAPTYASKTYYSTDGSHLRLDVSFSAPDQYGQRNIIWKLIYPDGTRVESTAPDQYQPSLSIPSSPPTQAIQRIYDRNGNVITTEQLNLSTVRISDDVGRSITIEGLGSSEELINSVGAGSEQVQWKVKWKNVLVNKTYDPNGTIPQNGSPSPMYTMNNSLRVVDQIISPPQLSNLTYTFNYNANAGGTGTGWGEVSSIVMPSGAHTDYVYNTDGQNNIHVMNVLGNYLTSKQLVYQSEDDGVTNQRTESWTYELDRSFNIDYVSPANWSKVTMPNGKQVTEYYLQGSSDLNGKVYKTEELNGVVIERSWMLSPTMPASPPGTYSNVNPYLKTEFISIRDAAGNLSKTAIKDYQYDQNGNITEIKEYDWVAYSSVPRQTDGKPLEVPTGAPLKRVTVNSYYNQTPDASSTDTSSLYAYWKNTSPALKNTVANTEIRDGNQTPVSRTEFSYDNYSTTGNVTEVKIWDSAKDGINRPYSNPLTATNSISVATSYDQYGNPTLMTDAKGYQTQNTYGSVGGYTNLYPTQIVTAYGTAIQRTSTAEYDFYTGLIKKTTDVDNNVSNETVYDALGRPQISKAATGTPLEVWTQTEYNDAARRVIVRSDLETKGDGRKVSIQHYDQIGRVRLSRMLENSATQSATNEADGIKVQTRYLTSNPYSYQLTSNPYRAATSGSASNEPSMGWTRSKMVNTGRHTEATTFSGSSLPAPWGTNANSSGTVSTDIDADRTLVADQTGKQRISRTNALGQMTDVWEITTADSSTVPVSFPNQTLSAGYQTSYQYDTLNNLKTVGQGSQTRTFSYSSLSRLLSAQNPESGSINYSYDNNGNLQTKTDARGIQTSYSYDVLNRIISRSYNDGATPAVSYTYDNLPNAKGKLTKVGSSVSTTEYTSFDTLGRVLGHKQTTDGTAYTTAYNYNLSGALTDEIYPSGRAIKNVLDNNGDLSQVKSKKNQNSGFYNYAKTFTYTAAGAVSSMQLGNGKWESTVFNSRLQPTQIALGTVRNGTDKLKLNYDYGTTDNNGNVKQQQITVPTTGTTQGFTATQNYTYDSLNRLKQAVETIPTLTGWQQTFTYDRYGNRNFDTNNTTTLGGCPANVCNPTVNTANNRLNGYVYDSAGNTTTDASGKTFTYDAENKQTQVVSGGQTVGQYFYDGDGKRVKKVVGTETTIFVYDVGGKMVAEYSTIAPSTAKVSYLTSDALGSPRINTNEKGDVFARHDYLPFGEEINSSITQTRNINLQYGDDGIKKKFTAYERDNETDLDYAKARYYKSQHGRFTTTDPSRKSIDPMSPQTWNRYTYCYNNPLTLVDENGKWPSPTHDRLIANSFRGLTDAQISLIQTGSRNVDRIADGKPGSTLWPSEAYKHAMTPDGMTEDQARGKSWDYLKDKLSEVKSLQKGWEKLGGQGLSGSALIALGEATHVYEDMTSPAHGFDKTYKIPTMTVLVPIPGTGAMVPVTVTDVAKWKQELNDHSAQESGEPTTEQRSQTALYSRAFFLVAFGEKEFKRLDLTNEERKSARELADRYRRSQ